MVINIQSDVLLLFVKTANTYSNNITSMKKFEQTISIEKKKKKHLI